MNNQYSFLNNAHPEFIEKTYQEYKANPDSVDVSWQNFFQGFEFASSDQYPAGQEYKRKELYVLNLINAYRTRGHLFTKTNPVRTRRKYEPNLDLQNYNLSEDDLDTTFQAGVEIGLGPATLREIRAHLEETYCKSVGAEYMFIRIPERVKWLQERMEATKNQARLTLDQKRRILDNLNHAVVFESFLHARYAGQKRFSLQGGETLIPGLDALIEKGAELGVEEFMIGMPHRGRLNVLANILKKDYEDIFTEFEGEEFADSVFEGDVKYHLGFSSRYKTSSGKEVQVGLAPNPSHLEAVDPVVEGMVRSKIEHKYQGDHHKIVPILIHGDAAIAGQGVVYEVIQMSLLKGYSTGGTIHMVVNNQLGFTTNYLDGRSSVYCTDVAKVTLSPVFHVNADDAEAVAHAVQMAIEYRQKYHTDVFIDLLGYRKYGHNEGDEPRFTQPKLYKTIARHPDARVIYNDNLLSRGSVEEGLAREMEKEYRALLQEKLDMVKSKKVKSSGKTYLDSCDHKRRFTLNSFEAKPETAVKRADLDRIAGKIFNLPDDINLIPKMRRIYQDRYQRYTDGRSIDWGTAEALAYATLLEEQTPVRLSGQDSVRGTFSHRHSILLEEDDETKYVPLNNISNKQAAFQVYNSPLSEYGVLGFEYGYACANPDGLTIWEAQFGDFNNGAQIIIDEFIASSELKWNRSNGIVLYLPHGYEGQGPDHSSARMERFLLLCANDNMRLANCTSPSNFFHLIRSQTKYAFRTPLILFTPKSLLRHPSVVSPVDEFVSGAYQEVLDDNSVDKSNVKRLMFCSGKVYFDLLERKQKDERDDVALIRLEQIYPFPTLTLQGIIEAYKNAGEYVWVQEEPQNAGAYWFIAQNFTFVDLHFVARKASPTPATGFFKNHLAEQKLLVDRAFAKTLS